MSIASITCIIVTTQVLVHCLDISALRLMRIYQAHVYISGDAPMTALHPLHTCSYILD